MAAQPEISQVIQFHAGFRRDGGRDGRFSRTHFHLGMANRMGIGFSDFASPRAACQRYGNGIAGFRLQGQFCFGNAFPGATGRFDTVVFPAVIIGNGEGAVRVDVNMAAQPEVRQVIQFHAGFRGNGGRDGGFNRAHFHLGVANRMGIGFRDFANPRAACQRYGNGIAGFRLQGQFCFGNAFPGATGRFDTVVFPAVIIGNGEGAVRVDVNMAAQPEVRQVIQFHAGFRRNGGSVYSFSRAYFHLGMADGMRVRFSDFASPRAVRQGDGNIVPAVGMQGQFGFGNAFPGAMGRFDTVVFSAVIIGDGEGAVRIDENMAAQPEVRQVVQFHAVFGRDSVRLFFRFGLRFGNGRFRSSRRFRGLNFHSRGGFFLRSLRLGLEEAEPQHGSRDRQHQQENDQALPAHFLPGHLQKQDDNNGQNDGVEQGNHRVPVRRIVAFHLHGGAVGLGIQDIMAGFPHGDAGGIVGGIDARPHEAQHHIVPGAHGQVGVHPTGVSHGGVRDHHAHEAPFIP